jgi:ABC-type Na+ transport system ATPase subunit NatA
MAERRLLHKNKLDLLKEWLSAKGYEIQATKDFYEVLRAKKDKNTVIIFRKNDVKEHLTVQQKDHALIRQFIRETKRSDAE